MRGENPNVKIRQKYRDSSQGNVGTLYCSQ